MRSSQQVLADARGMLEQPAFVTPRRFDDLVANLRRRAVSP